MGVCAGNLEGNVLFQTPKNGKDPDLWPLTKPESSLLQGHVGLDRLKN